MSSTWMKVMAVILLVALGIPGIILLAVVYHPWFFLLCALYLAIPFIFWRRQDKAAAARTASAKRR
jgi:hypothetical protein